MVFLRSRGTVDVSAYESARETLSAIRCVHEMCCGPVEECRDAIRIATNTAALPPDGRAVRLAVREHAAVVNQTLESRAGHAVAGVAAVGRRLQNATGLRFH